MQITGARDHRSPGITSMWSVLIASLQYPVPCASLLRFSFHQSVGDSWFTSRSLICGHEWFTSYNFVWCAWDSILYLFFSQYLSRSLLEHSLMGPEFCCKAHFGSTKVSLLTNGLLLNKSLPLSCHMYQMMIIGTGVRLLNGTKYFVPCLGCSKWSINNGANYPTFTVTNCVYMCLPS